MSDANNLISHLIELRSRILKALLSVLIVFICLAAFAQDLYKLLAMPLLEALPENASMIATDVASPFFAPFKLTLVLSFFIAIPYVLYQVWGFVAPGLYRNEKRLVRHCCYQVLCYFMPVWLCLFCCLPLRVCVLH